MNICHILMHVLYLSLEVYICEFAVMMTIFHSVDIIDDAIILRTLPPFFHIYVNVRYTYNNLHRLIFTQTLENG